jgi:hypothetical protein
LCTAKCAVRVLTRCPLVRAAFLRAQEVAERVVTHLSCVGDKPDVRKVADSLSTIAFAESGGRSVFINPAQYGVRVPPAGTRQ